MRAAKAWRQQRQDVRRLDPRLWGAGFLPSQYQGVLFRSQGDTVLYLRNPPGVDDAARRTMLDALAAMNAHRHAREGDPRRTYVPTDVTMPQGVDMLGGSAAGCDGWRRRARWRGATTPIPFLGISLWLDPNAVFLTLGLGSAANGRATLPLPIPASAAPGYTLDAQFVWMSPTAPSPCPPSASSLRTR